MTVQHRFECLHCEHRIRATGPDSATARQAAREDGAAHVNEAHADLLAASVRWPDELSPDDLLSGEAAYGGIRGWLAPADDLLVCADCGYYFDGEDDHREPSGQAAVICTACRERRLESSGDPVADAIESFVR